MGVKIDTLSSYIEVRNQTFARCKQCKREIMVPFSALKNAFLKDLQMDVLSHV